MEILIYVLAGVLLFPVAAALMWVAFQVLALLWFSVFMIITALTGDK